MTDLALFDTDGMYVPPPDPEPPLSSDARRTRLQRDRINAGFHPLLVAVHGANHHTKVHPDAPTDCAPDAPRSRPFTCGSCRFRMLFTNGNGVWPKCTYGIPDQYPNLDKSPRTSHGAATDVRAWWPACADYEPGDNTLSPDASRQMP